MATKKFFDPDWKYIVEDGTVHQLHKIVAHEFSVGDAEDPDLYAAGPLSQWEQSEKGQWVMSHAVETPIWHRLQDYAQLSYRYRITAVLKGKDYTFWTLKWGSKIS